MRLFVSVDLPDLGPAVEGLQEALAPASGIRLTDPRNTHVTLKFLGEVDDDRVDRISEALQGAIQDAGVAPFDVRLAGLGAFPSESYISVVWVGVEAGSSQLESLHDAVEERMTSLGFEPEEHTFTPHATIARMDHAGGKERVQELLSERDPDLGVQPVDHVALTESTLTEDGPVYETITSVPLAE